jgi:hypothetical protein
VKLGRHSQRQSARRHARRRNAGATHAAHAPLYRTPRPALARRTGRCGPLVRRTASPLPLPGRHVPRTPWPGRADRPMSSLPYRRTRHRHTTPMLRPGRHGELANRLSNSRPSIKGCRCSSSRSTVPLWPPLPPPASSTFRVCSRPTDCPGTSTRTSRSLPTHALPWPSPRLAGAQAPAAPAAGLRRAARRWSLSSKTSAQVGSPQPLEPSQALPGRGRRRGRRNSPRPPPP